MNLIRAKKYFQSGINLFDADLRRTYFASRKYFGFPAVPLYLLNIPRGKKSFLYGLKGEQGRAHKASKPCDLAGGIRGVSRHMVEARSHRGKTRVVEGGRSEVEILRLKFEVEARSHRGKTRGGRRWSKVVEARLKF
jgi:hypothetical protein